MLFGHKASGLGPRLGKIAHEESAPKHERHLRSASWRSRFFRREDLETFVSFTERAAYCLETAFRGPLILASKPLSSLLDFLSESCGLTHDGLLVTELARAIVSINSKRFLSHQSWLRLRTLASFELCVGLPEIREKSELLPYPAAILDGRFVVVGMLLVATG